MKFYKRILWQSMFSELPTVHRINQSYLKVQRLFYYQQGMWARNLRSLRI